MDDIREILARMETKDAAGAVAAAARDLFPLLDEEARREFIGQMLDEPGGDKVIGLVHL